jgi:single-strand DNA-binding protein
MGRLTRDPDVRYTNSQTGDQLCIARYTLAVDRRFARRNGGDDSQSADFISCVAFGRQGEFAEKYLKQGTKIAATGRIQTGSYTNKDGQKVYTTEVVVEEQEFAESKNGSGSGSQGGYEPQSAPMSSDATAEGFMNIPEGASDDLPFKK